MRFCKDKDLCNICIFCEVLTFIKVYVHVAQLLIFLQNGVYDGGLKALRRTF